MVKDKAMLKIKNVTKSFGDIVAVENLSFDVKDGEFIFITGPSGAGKTTLIRLILRELLPDKGEIVFDGENIVGLKNKDIPDLRRRIGVVFQDYKLLLDRTVRENVEVALAALNIDQVEWNDRVNKVLKLVGLDERSELFPAQLSGGELQRTSLARALVVNPKMLLADEPTGNLDWDTVDSIMDLLEKINKEGKTVIMATHHKLIVDKLKKRTIELEKSKKVKVKVKEKGKKDDESEKRKTDSKKRVKVKVEEK
jgi:cell division transport system ATP-binding protein